MSASPLHRWRTAPAILALAAMLSACGSTPRHPVPALPAGKLEQLRADALRAQPPEEAGEFRASDLVEPARLDPGLKLDVRYATSDNFMRAPVYPEARVFLHRPAAEALVRVNQALRAEGYGLLLFDGYRPWYVTWMFWEATPNDQRNFVANPEVGSRHNRGAAIDLTLYELRTGLEVPMPSAYDEFSERAHPAYTGGTAPQRESRDRLRRAMEAEGYTVNPDEWWHFDYRGWEQYPIGNVFFKDLE